MPQLEFMKRLHEIGFERTRRAVAALALSLFVCLYLLISLNAPPGWGLPLVALAACYVVAFLGVAAEWFWGRWFASGLGWSGVMVAVASLVMIGWTPPLAIYGGLHALVVVLLLGKKMAARYDLQEAWRQRFDMDEYGVARLRKTVTRAAASLPSVILWALGPKEPGQGMLVAGLAAVLLVVAGLRGLVLMRTWGLLALAGSFVIVAASGHVRPFVDGALDLRRGFGLDSFNGPMLAAICLGAALVPFAAPVARFLSRRR